MMEIKMEKNGKKIREKIEKSQFKFRSKIF
jgi:hypothetical protein